MYTSAKVRFVPGEGGRLDWGPNGQLAVDGRNPDGTWGVFIKDPDGSNGRCITNGPGLPKRGSGQPAWHPSGDYIVFQCLKPEFAGAELIINPGSGLGADLWLTNAEGSKYWQLTDLSLDRRPFGSLHPHFSHDGKKLLWGSLIGAVRPYGKWEIMVADFARDPEPHLENVRAYTPGPSKVWYETHGFTPDGKGIIFAGDLDPGLAVEGMDIYLMDLETQEYRNLTNSPTLWDEHAHISPDGKTVVWMTNLGDPVPLGPGEKHFAWLRTDFWLMDIDGSNKRQITFFNKEGHEHYRGRPVLAADCDWSPDGTQIAGHLQMPEFDADGKLTTWEEQMVILDLE